MQRVLRFLGVDETVPLELVSANPTVAVRSLRVQTAVRVVRQGRDPVSRGAQGAVIALTSSRMRRDVLHPMRRRVLYSAPPPPDESLHARAAPSLQGRGGGAERVPGPRPGEPVGL